MGNKLNSVHLLLAMLLFLPACGYHLRGALDIPEPLKKVYMPGASANLQDEMRLSLQASGGQLVATPDQAELVIKVLRDEMSRRVLSLSSVGKANEFELNYNLRYLLLNAEGKLLTDQQVVEIHRDYFNDQEDILAKNNEENVIRQEMYRQAVRTMFTRVRAVLK